MGKKKFIVLISMMILILLSASACFSETLVQIDDELGVVHVNNPSNGENVKVIITNGKDKYIYGLSSSSESFPLQMGSGKYTIGIYELVEGKKYKQLYEKTQSISIVSTKEVFLNSVQNINWSENSRSSIIAREVTKDANNDMEKVQMISNYIVNNISYDYDKANAINSRYLPNNSVTLDNRSGICYDYASLLASMLRSEGIPVKLLMGNAKGIDSYHAWNEVYVEGSWHVVDLTSDQIQSSAGISYSLFKNSSDYQVEKVY